MFFGTPSKPYISGKCNKILQFRTIYCFKNHGATRFREIFVKIHSFRPLFFPVFYNNTLAKPCRLCYIVSNRKTIVLAG